MARKMKDSGIEWIGDIPERWEIKYFVQLFSQVKNKNIGLREKNLLSLSYGKIKQKSIETVGGLLPDNFEGYNIIDSNDIVLRLTDLQNDQHSLRVGLSHERGIITSAYCSIRVRGAESPNYLYYYLHTFDIAKGFYGMGSGVRQGLNWDGLKSIKILLPPQHEQDRISVFLNQKTLEIDSMLSKTISSIEEYKKLKQAVITQAVTKGVRGKRNMKNSEVPWIGEIPAEWDIIKSSRIIKTTQNGLSRRDLEKSEGQIILKLKNITSDGKIDYSFLNRIALSQNELNTYALTTGDFLFVRVNGSKSLVGKCAIFEAISEIVAYNDHIIRVKLSNQCYNRFFLWYLYSCCGKAEIDLHTSTAAGQYTISGDGLRDITLVFPPIDEQKEIADHLDAKCTEIDKLIAKKEQLVKELESYKKSLIYEVVTGKREV